VSRPTEDICSFCYTFQHSFRLTRRSSTAEEDAGSDEDDEDAANIPPPPPPPVWLPPPAEDVDFSDDEEEEPLPGVAVEEEKKEDEEVKEEVLHREKVIDDAVKHVKMARVQHILVNEKMSKAKEDAAANTIHSERFHTFIVDYGQNMQLPWFGTSQPGDTYYYTPLTIFNLGVVDVFHPDGEHLYCHLYKKGDGKKGGDNVASLLMKSLRQLNVLQEGCRGKELNVVFDNCPG
jgi:hypothetical protein